MEAESPPPLPPPALSSSDVVVVNARLNKSCEEIEPDDSINGFNKISNITVIENETDNTKTQLEDDNIKLTTPQCEGSDSGVEFFENNERIAETNSQEFLNSGGNQSCNSSVISCCSNYEEAFNILVRRNSTLLEDYTLRNSVGVCGDGASENGSESSSITGSSSSKNSKNLNSKRKISTINDKKSLPNKSKPPITPKTTISARLKSIDRCQKTSQSTNCKGSNNNNSNNNKTKTTPNLSLDIKKRSPRTSSTTRTPSVTPTDDGRWPSVNSKPAPLMSRSLRGILDLPKSKILSETKTIEKYATLPRRRKEKSTDEVKDQNQKKKDDVLNRLSITRRTPHRDSTPSKVMTPQTRRRQRIKIYHEISNQTVLTMTDIDKALSGVSVKPLEPSDIEKCDKSEQVDLVSKPVEDLRLQLKQLQEKYDELILEHKTQTEKLKETQIKLREETVEKEGLKEELKMNSQRVLAILGEGTNEEENCSSDSLLVLESRFQNVSQIVIRQEEEISKLNSFCRSLQIELEKSQENCRLLQEQHQYLENESVELQEFLQAEKTTLSDALKDAESEIQKHSSSVAHKEKELQEKKEEIKRLTKLNEQRWQENLTLQARLGALEAKSRELLVHQGSSVSGTAVALSALIGRLEGLVDELVTSYNISEQELEDVIFHNEAYSNSSSSPDATPEKSRKFLPDKTPSPKKGSSFVSAVINAIKNAAAQSPFSGNKDMSRDNLCAEHSSSNEMLDSETEPCLMMEHVLEDVVIPDGHSHNMISSCHSMLSSQSHSESLIDFSRRCHSLTSSYSNDICDSSYPSSFSLVDQVIDVDNLVTRLLKVIRIIQLETDDCMNELQEQRDSLSEQVDRHKESNKLVVKQLKDWEVLGSRLKSEVKELLSQLSKKNNEIDNFKSELNNQREQVEKLNQDVCELSTALAKAEFETKLKEEEVAEAIKNWDKNGEEPTADVLGRLIVSHNEIPNLRAKLEEKERQLRELTQEFLASRQVLTESLKEAVKEAKKQYAAIDNALEVLHNNQNVVQQCTPLADLQRDLENINFQSATAMPLITPADCNANAALLQAIANLQINPINTTA